MTSRRFVPRGSSRDCCCWCPHPHSERLPTHASAGDPLALAGRSGSVSWGVPAPFPWVPVHTRFCVCPPGVDTLSPNPVKVLQSSPAAPSRSGSLGIPSLFAGPQAGKPDVGLSTLTALGGLWYHCALACGLPIWWVENYIDFYLWNLLCKAGIKFFIMMCYCYNNYFYVADILIRCPNVLIRMLTSNFIFFWLCMILVVVVSYSEAENVYFSLLKKKKPVKS